MPRITAAALLALLLCASAQAQMAIPIASCGTIAASLTPTAPHALYMDQATGRLCTSGGVAVAGGATSSSFGSAFPATGTAAGFSDGTNMVAGRTDPATAGAIWTAPVGRGSIATSQVSVAITATSVCPARAARNVCTITMTGAVDAFCGPSGVTTATGSLLLGTKGSQVNIPTVAQVFCIVATGSASVSVMETF